MNKFQIKPVLSIGLPIYNRPELLRQCLESLLRQTFRDFELIISDDFSPGDKTQKVVKVYSDQDDRIVYYRQKNNIGPFANHKFVLDQAISPYFLWVSEDDWWSDDFLQIGMETLIANNQYDAWCCTIDNIDSFNRPIRQYSGFSRWTSTKNKRKDIFNFLIEPEIMGKPHIFHSIFRSDSLKQTLNDFPIRNLPGNDICFGLAFLTRFNLVATDRVLFHKRVARLSDETGRTDHIVITDPYRYAVLNPKFYFQYYIAARKTEYRYFVTFALLAIWPVMFCKKYFSIEFFKKVTVAFLMMFGYRLVNSKKTIFKTHLHSD